MTKLSEQDALIENQRETIEVIFINPFTTVIYATQRLDNQITELIDLQQREVSSV